VVWLDKCSTVQTISPRGSFTIEREEGKTGVFVTLGLTWIPSSFPRKLFVLKIVFLSNSLKVVRYKFDYVHEKEKNSDRKIINVWQEFVGKKLKKQKQQIFEISDLKRKLVSTCPFSIWCWFFGPVGMFFILIFCLSVFLSMFVSFFLCLYPSFYVCIFLSMSVSFFLCLYLSFYICIFLSMFVYFLLPIHLIFCRFLNIVCCYWTSLFLFSFSRLLTFFLLWCSVIKGSFFFLFFLFLMFQEGVRRLITPYLGPVCTYYEEDA